MTGRHSLLERQLDRCFGAEPPAELGAFLGAVDGAYHQFDVDRRMLERSLDLSSDELLQANAELRARFNAFPDVFLRARTDGTILEVKRSTAPELFGGEGVAGRRIQDLGLGELSAGFADAVAELRDGSETFRLVYSLPPDQPVEWFEARLVRSPVDEILIVVRDVTSQKRAEERLLHEAIHDVLTGLPNRTLLLDRLGQALHRAKRDRGARFAVLFVDLDRLKVINDSLGHPAGDELLCIVAKRLAASVRPGDTVARTGGDEFVVVVEGVGCEDEAVAVAERIGQAVAEPIHLAGYELQVTGSIGIAWGALHYSEPQELLRDADTAMYVAKRRGGAQHQIFQPGMHLRALTRLELETDLRQAVPRRELVLHYQPIVDLASGRILGLEALVRWRHPERGLLMPGEFVPLAEETGQIVPIGVWVLDEACRQMAAWSARFAHCGEMTISVNLSPRQLTRPELASTIAASLRASGLPADRLALEITENVLMEQPAAAAEILQRLHELGVRLHLDDFGVGYSSLAYLHRLPIDALKVDRSFVARVCEPGARSEIVRTINSLGRRMGFRVIAEGIETAAQAERLRTLGGTLGQGYLYSRPIDVEAATVLVGRGGFEQSGDELEDVGPAEPLRLLA